MKIKIKLGHGKCNKCNKKKAAKLIIKTSKLMILMTNNIITIKINN